MFQRRNNMEEQVKQLEEMLGLKYEEWNAETIRKIVDNPEMFQKFSKEVIIHLIETRDNIGLADILTPVKYGFKLLKLKEAVEAQLKEFKENNLDIEVFKQKILDLKKDPISKIGVYLTLISTIEGYDLTKEKDEVLKTIDEYIDIIKKVNTDYGFELVIELVDLLFPFREVYFQLYKEDILKDNKEIEEILKQLDEKTKFIFEQMKQQEESEEKEEIPPTTEEKN
jgi:hypothetical protein